MFKGFRDFILRGNVVDLAVAVIIGAAFSQITTALTSNIITPFISAVIGAPDFSNLVFHMHVFHHINPNSVAAIAPCVATPQTPCPPIPGDIHYGVFLNALVNFLLNAAAIYFLIVLPVHKLLQRINGPEAVTTKPCPQCLGDIPLAATRCKFCTQPVLNSAPITTKA
ncbi:MAG TPA: large conductance mechanosensitive channel protein MscL [Acidobacteriaceae bacterium]|nr:large conductance mechanosensitive channel protein MscL [Acidobacteriaceae bacterium]